MKNKHYYIVLSISCMLMFVGYHPEVSCQPKIGVVFGGGGAKGAAEVGVLKVLESAGIKADYVAGTSMGAVIGGLYAAGYKATEIERMLLNEEWMWLFDKTKIVNPGDHRLLGLIKGPYFKTCMDAALSKKGAHLFTHIRTPFVCVATNIKNNDFKEVDMREGVVAESIRISMAYPAPGNVPIVMDGKELADGGMVNNLPVDVVRRMGADIVIAIDLEQGDENHFSFGIPTLGIVTKWLNKRPDIAKRQKNIDGADVYIHPNLKGFSIKDYNRKSLTQMINIGQQTAQSHYQELLRIKNK